MVEAVVAFVVAVVVAFVVALVVEAVVGLVVAFVVALVVVCFVVVGVVSVLVVVVDVVVSSSVVVVVVVSVADVLSEVVVMLVSEDNTLSYFSPVSMNLQPLNAARVTLAIRHTANTLILFAFVFAAFLVIILTFYLTFNHSLDFFNSPVLNNKHCKINVCVCYRGGFILSGNSP